MLSATLVIGASLAYLMLLFVVAAFGDRRAAQGRSIIGNAWIYALSMAVYCTAWTYFGSVGGAAASGLWFLPIYLGPMLAMLLAWLVVRKMIRIAKTYRITSIADFIASRYGKSRLIAALVTLITVVGIVPYIALQLQAISSGYGVLTSPLDAPAGPDEAWWRDGTLYVALALAAFTIVFGTRHLDGAERHEGMVAAIAFESVVKLLAFLAVGCFVTWGMFDGPADIAERARASPELQNLVSLAPESGTDVFEHERWFALVGLAAFAALLLPRQFQVMVVENVDERHLRRAAWVFPLYLLLINLFVLPIALGGELWFGPGRMDAENHVLALPLAQGQQLLALVAFIGGLSAATGMLIVETIAVSTMVCNDLVMPSLLRLRRFSHRAGGDLTGLLLGIRRLTIVGVLLLGYLYFHLAGEVQSLVSIGLISFAAVAQFAPALFGGMYWRGATSRGALGGLVAGFILWAYTLMLPSLARSGWLPSGFLEHGPFGFALLLPERLFGLEGLDNLTHSLFWSLLANLTAFVGLSLWGRPSARETSQALLFVDVFERSERASADAIAAYPGTAGAPGAGDPGAVAAAAAASGPVFWRGRARVADLLSLAGRFLGAMRARQLFEDYGRQVGARGIDQIVADARLVQFVETQLAGAVGSASARLVVSSVVDEETLGIDDVMNIVEETSQLRRYAQALEDKSRSLERAGAQLRAANEQLQSLDHLKDDFMSSVTHELRTPLTSIRALSELMVDDPGMNVAQRQQFLAIIVAESERLSRLVNQVLDLAKIESGHAQWHNSEVDMPELLRYAIQATAELFHERDALVSLEAPPSVRPILADRDRLLQVLVNLLSNAAKFVPRHEGRVEVRLRTDETGLTLEVSDNGPGVAPEQQALVFEKFRQGGEGPNPVPGTGLGLSISRQIVTHFGGRMWLRSEPGQGACFAFWLPWRNDDVKVEEGEERHEPANPDCRR